MVSLRVLCSQGSWKMRRTLSKEDADLKFISIAQSGGEEPWEEI